MKLSVVMSVYNGATDLAPTLDSILAQSERDFELIVIDDGSNDGTLPILAIYARRDPRIRVLTQVNVGLTRSLMRGCAAAAAPIIARHDCGDRSHPERLAKQLRCFNDPDVVLVSCTTRFVSPDGDTLYVVRAEGEEVRNSLLHDDGAHLRSIPAHPSAMFRRDAYSAAGGYREHFRLGQDLDLWVRLAKIGRIVVLEDELYEATFQPNAISGLSRDAQVRAAALIVALRDGGDERALLEEVARLRPRRAARRGDAGSWYFIARCLRAQKNPAARRYLLETIRRSPFHWRAWVSLMTGR